MANCFTTPKRRKSSSRWIDVANRLCRDTLRLAALLGIFSQFAHSEDRRGFVASDLKELTVEELMDIEVTSVSRQPEKLSETASSIQVVTGEDIRKSGAASIAEALRSASNLQVAQKGSHSWGISARGFNTDLANKLLVMIDGRTVYTPLYSGVFWDKQDYLLEDIDRIEVISGPGGTLWGANAVNGVINIMTKPARESQGLYLESGIGSELQGFAGGRYGGEIGTDSYYRVYGKYFERDGAVYENGSDATDSWFMGQGGFRIDAASSPNDNVTLQGDYYKGEQDLVAGGTGKIAGGNILARWNHLFSGNSDLDLQIYYDRTHLSLPTPALIINSTEFAPAGRLKDDLDTYDIDFQHRLQLGQRNSFVWGFGYRATHDKLENSPALAFLPAAVDQNLFSTFVQDEVKLSDAFFFTLGTKLEHNDYTGWEAVPSARLQWSFAHEQLLWGAVSRAVRTPSRIDRDISQPAPPYLVVLAGGKGFRSETVVAYELGYRGTIGTSTALSLSTFYNDYDHIRSTSMTPMTILPFFFENNLEGETYGFELNANYYVTHSWRIQGGYNLLKADMRIKPGKSDFNNALNENADPQQQVFLGSTIEMTQNLDLGANLRWVDQLHNNNGPTPGIVPSYFELDLRLGWSPNDNFEISVTGQNLLHDHHPEYAFPSPAREEIQRGFYGKVAWRP